MDKDTMKSRFLPEEGLPIGFYFGVTISMKLNDILLGLP